MTTDAPLPSSNSNGDAFAPPALFDTLRIDIVEPFASAPCSTCSRTIAVDANAFVAGASFGIAPKPGTSGYRARFRLYRSEAQLGADPPGASSIETVIALPPLVEGESLEITAWLPTDALGSPIGTLDEPSEPRLGHVVPGHPGDWIGARRLLCTGIKPNNAACVPGGAYWMGSAENFIEQAPDGFRSDLERLVVLSPFYLGEHEVTVEEFRASGLSPEDDTDTQDPLRWTGVDPPLLSSDFCTYTDTPSAHDPLPVTCLSWKKAAEFCKAVGGLLPTEAEYEYAASRLRSERYPWGSDRPACHDAVFSRGPAATYTGFTGCFDELGLLGPSPAGNGLLDRLSLEDGEVVDLAGNVSEWMRDKWNRQEEACWGSGIFNDPDCETASKLDPDTRAVRGGSWATDPSALRAARKNDFAADYLQFRGAIGFRCVWPGNWSGS